MHLAKQIEQGRFFCKKKTGADFSTPVFTAFLRTLFNARFFLYQTD
jgi:hypothetical protein